MTLAAQDVSVPSCNLQGNLEREDQECIKQQVRGCFVPHADQSTQVPQLSCEGAGQGCCPQHVCAVDAEPGVGSAQPLCL